MRAAILALLAAACAPDLPKQSNVVKLRVLAVRADPPELIAGVSTAVSLSALAVQPSGEPIDLRWALCPLPANLPPPAQLDCPGSSGIDLPGARLDLSDPGTQPLWPVFFSTEDGTPLTQAQREDLLTSGTSLVVGISASSGSEILDGFAEVPLLQPPAAVHENPEMRALLVNGVELPADGSGVLPAGTKVRLEPVQASGTDPLNFTFFATDGDVDSLRSADQTVTGEPADPSIDYTVPVSPGEVRFWVVVRDGRGGVGWLTRTAQVR